MTSPDKSQAQSPFNGVVTGRRLLQVVGVCSATDYKSDKDADEFWLILEGDTPDNVLWLHPHWRYFGANDGFQMACETQMLELGQRPNAVPVAACACPAFVFPAALHLKAALLTGLPFEFLLCRAAPKPTYPNRHLIDANRMNNARTR